MPAFNHVCSFPVKLDSGLDVDGFRNLVGFQIRDRSLYLREGFFLYILGGDD
jgi:hypothetical protein